MNIAAVDEVVYYRSLPCLSSVIVCDFMLLSFLQIVQNLEGELKYSSNNHCRSVIMEYVIM